MYDTYIYDEHPADRRHLRDLLVQYQIRSNVEVERADNVFENYVTTDHQIRSLPSRQQ